MASPAMEYRPEGLILGTAVKMFSIVGPVIVYGLAASMVCGVFFWLAG
jgi:stage V sporulation protein AC